MPGPPKNPNARRRNARPDWRTLPSAGRAGAPPAYPIGKPTKAIAAVWTDLWSSPQAVAWEELGWTRVVARYARVLVAAEKPNAAASLLAEVRQLEDRLGLSPMAMKRLQWEIGPSSAAASSGDDDQAGKVARLDDYRDRLG